jgi:hypothetical protein
MPASPSHTPVPYETLIDFALVAERLNGLAQEFYELDTRINGWISEQLGLRDLPDTYSDRVVEEFGAAVEARLESEGDGAS